VAVSTSGPNLYDAYYYAHDCGTPYERNDAWLGFFGHIADWIVDTIQPTSVLDAGCAYGFLVEALRARGVEADGIDISEYAIAHVDPSMRDFCQVGSVLTPLDRRYDLIVCIEVLEHLDPMDAARAIANFAAHSDDVLFSSTPFDYRELTHFNVQPPDRWAALFADEGLFHDVEYDGTVLTPWAMRFRRLHQPVSTLIATYERALWRLTQVCGGRRDAALALRADLVRLELSEQAARVRRD
jgi:SAM-dependent methyltransferase